MTRVTHDPDPFLEVKRFFSSSVVDRQWVRTLYTCWRRTILHFTGTSVFSRPLVMLMSDRPLVYKWHVNVKSTISVT